jgi:hypothetical protein
LLRDAGIELTTMAEHYGEQAGQKVADVDWIAATAQRGWLVFNKDAAIRRTQPRPMLGCTNDLGHVL